MRIEKVEQSNKEFVEKKKSNLKYFLNLCKYDVLPSAASGSLASAFLVNAYTMEGVTDAMIFGSVAGTAFILAVNGVITGVKLTKEHRDKIRQKIDDESTYLDNKGKAK